MDKDQQNNKSRIPQLRMSKLSSSIPSKLSATGSMLQVKSRGVATSTSTDNCGSQIVKTTNVSQEKKPAATSIAPKTSNHTRRRWAPSSSVKNSNINKTVRKVRRPDPVAKPATKSITIAQEMPKRTIYKPVLKRAIGKDVMTNNDRQRVPQKRPIMSAPTIKKMNDGVIVDRNVRRREALSARELNELNNLRDRFSHLKDDIGAAEITKAVAIAGRTALESEKERLKREHNTHFIKVCHLEHVLACEQSKTASFLDQIAKRQSDYVLITREKEDLIINLTKLEEKTNEADKELEELEKDLANSGAELEEAIARLDVKLRANAELKSTVDQLRLYNQL
ncbi:7308_t:CDS:1 [Funneliformis geosporum]|uniref:4434_t:CDS:1 n=1 Tax=Funneliformis geosporum TaxID=1117311 RepID=A0A9W4WWY2_9GLOM|nr:4434_t:CDS:1 [Funneliformis geosporum]CAI2177868.1 7308_t:CDS:1 [Funneliformis geosporum]